MNEPGACVFIVHTFPPVEGGVQQYLYGICEGMRNTDLTVVAPMPDNVRGVEEFDSGQRMKILRMQPGRSRQGVICAIAKILKRFGDSYQAKRSGWLKGFFRMTRVLLATLRYRYYSSMTNASLSQLTEAMKGKRIGVTHSGYILPSGVTSYILYVLFGIPYVVYTYGMELFVWEERFFCRSLMRTILANAARVKVIMTIARHVERKGQDMVIRAMPRVLERHPEAVYVIGGRGMMESRLKALASELGVEENIRFVGLVSDDELSLHYRMCDIFIMASRRIGNDVEGFGIVFLEAGYWQKPVVGGRSGGVEDAVVDGGTGILVDPQSPGQIADALIRLLDDEALAHSLGTAGRQRVLDEFT
ncbi:MAG: hypothetical protein B6D63_06320, partial [Candidatus Latescibacteria bacterium 4484_7]